MRRNQQTSPHDQEIDDELDRLERNLFQTPVAADHTDRYPQPDEVNDHIPDIVTEGPFGGRTLIEVEHRDDDSQRTQEQQDAFERADIYDPTTEFEIEYVDDKDDKSGLFGLF